MKRFRAMFRKEVNQVRADRRLAFSLIVPPLLQVLLFGFALDVEVNELRIGVVDPSRSAESRELVASITSNPVFHLRGYYASIHELEDDLNRGRLDVGLVIPVDFAKDRLRGRSVRVQLILNAVNANTATISEGYVRALISAYNAQVTGVPGKPQAGPLTADVTFLYNPGLVTSWYIVTGVFGVLLVLNASIVAVAAMIKEKETGTVEQLLMTPASSTEVIAAKMAPLFVLLFGMATVVIVVAKAVFDVPMRGSIPLLACAAALCLLTGIALGTLLSTVSASAQQAQLLALFINPPMATLSGALTPIEAMPKWLQPVTLINPIRHFGEISRGILVKGAGLAELYLNFLALTGFAFILLAISVWRFRKQLT
jgi:ABC-type multidrug transport system, permease component